MTERISVTGTGSAAAPPDTAVVSVGVEVLARSVGRARVQAATDAAAVVEALRSGGVDAKDLTTTNFSIHPEYEHRNGRQLRGYRVTNTVEAAVHNLDTLGELIDAAAEAGGDSTVVAGIRFCHDDATAFDIAARTAAWQDARRKAAQLAELAGVSLGSAVTISEQTRAAPLPAMRAAAFEAAATPIETGELAVTVTLNVEFSIAP